MPENEAIFFANLKMVIGERHTKSKWVGKPVTKSDIFFDKDYRLYNFPDEINQIFVAILKELLSNEKIPKGSNSHNIDGIILNHPTYGTRIVEFDEEQHFTPFRKETLKYLSDTIIFKQIFLQHCNDLNCYHRMLNKLCIKISQESIPESTVKFQSFIEGYAEKLYAELRSKGIERSIKIGYIRKVPGFRFWGGRITQRAYYDILRDYAHLSSKNSGFLQSFRISQFEIENCYSKEFNKIKSEELQEYIENKLSPLKS